MRLKLSILFLIIFSFSELRAQKMSTNDPFISPLKPPFQFSGNFGEFRPSHFHSGLDFRTQGQTGLPVYAVKDGYISRIGISATGYGNALYMNHSDGTTSVYGHLQRFHPLLQEYVKEKQYDQESFQININLPLEKFHFSKGEIIAWSGNSGSSEGPHLHFEIRDTKSERVLNPLLFNLGIKDNSAPKILALYVYPLTANSNIGADCLKKRLQAMPVPGGYRLKNNALPEIFGQIGFGIEAEDYFNGTGLRCGIYSATLLYDGIKVFGFKMDNFSFGDTRYANAQTDFEEYIKTHHRVQRLYKLPGNSLNIYDPAGRNGILKIDDGKIHEFEIIVSDAFDNRTSLKFKTKSKKYKLASKNQSISKQFLYDQSNVFENEKIKIDLPKNALYDNLDFVWKPAPKPIGCYSELHQVQSKYVPLHKPYSLSIRCYGLPDSFSDKALIVLVDQNTGKKFAVGGEYSGGWLTVKTNLFGSFSVAIDKTPPAIFPLDIKDKKTLVDQSKVQFKIVDDLSGIKSYRGEIDGKWVLFEFDSKSGILTYYFDKTRMVFGKSHLIRLVVTDFRVNSTEYKAIIYR